MIPLPNAHNHTRSNVLILGASRYVVPLIRTCQEMGFRTHVCSNQACDPGLGLADVPHHISVLDRKALEELGQLVKPRAILTAASDLATLTVGHLNDFLGKDGVKLAQVLSVSHKGNFVELQARLDIPRPQSFCVRTRSDIETALVSLEFPLIMKPFLSSGSRGVKIVRNRDDILAHHDTCSCSSQEESGYVIQSYLARHQEIGCECLVEQGSVVFLEATHKFLNRYNVPIGHFAPNALSPEIESMIVDQVETIVAYLAIKNTAINLDILVNSNEQPVIIDMGFRLGGNLLPEVMGHTFGFCPYEKVIEYALGVDKGIDFPRGILGHTASIIFGAEQSMIMTKDLRDALHSLLSTENVLELVFDIEDGESIMPFTQGNYRIGHALFRPFSRPSYEAVLRKLKDIGLASSV